MGHRSDLNALSAPQRTQLVGLMLDYLTDAVVADHVSIVHSGEEIFTGHRNYILGMESHLMANGGAGFVPLPSWNSANPIPTEFNVVKNPGPARPPLVNLHPNIPKPAPFETSAVCEYDDPAQLGNDINGWHGSVHCAIGGTMCMLPVASAAPIFWCWHAFVDEIYWDWQRCTVTCPDLVGCTLPIAVKKIQAAGLKVGATACLPRTALPPAYQLPPYRDPDPSRYFHGQPHGHGHGHEDEPPAHGHGSKDAQGGQSRREPSPGELKRGDKTSRQVADHAPSHEFLHPVPDYSYLTRGPRVIGQCPGPYTVIKAGKRVDLSMIE
jgi:hypothetical protein